MFPVTREQAHTILVTSITRQFPGSAASPVELPYPGYRIHIRFLLDTHDIVAYMVKVKGVTDLVRSWTVTLLKSMHRGQWQSKEPFGQMSCLRGSSRRRRN